MTCICIALFIKIIFHFFCKLTSCWWRQSGICLLIATINYHVYGFLVNITVIPIILSGYWQGVTVAVFRFFFHFFQVMHAGCAVMMQFCFYCRKLSIIQLYPLSHSVCPFTFPFYLARMFFLIFSQLKLVYMPSQDRTIPANKKQWCNMWYSSL